MSQVVDPLEEIHKVAYADESVLPPPKVVKTAEQWEALLPKEAFYVCRKSDTENPFTGKFDKHYEKGIYRCIGCNEQLFKSDTKFNSGTGWPSFFSPATPNSIVYIKEGNARYFYEVKCATCHCVCSLKNMLSNYYYSLVVVAFGSCIQRWSQR